MHCILSIAQKKIHSFVLLVLLSLVDRGGSPRPSETKQLAHREQGKGAEKDETHKIQNVLGIVIFVPQDFVRVNLLVRVHPIIIILLGREMGGGGIWVSTNL